MHQLELALKLEHLRRQSLHYTVVIHGGTRRALDHDIRVRGLGVGRSIDTRLVDAGDLNLGLSDTRHVVVLGNRQLRMLLVV